METQTNIETLKTLTLQEIKTLTIQYLQQKEIEEKQKQTDKNITDILKGKYKRFRK